MTRPILLFGATSIVGHSLARQFPESVEAYGAPREARSLLLCSEAQRWPAILIYGHAVCDVPKCESAPEWAREINVGQVRDVLSMLPAQTRVVYVSSDHVFGGDGIYNEEAEPCPISVYGRTRVEAERLVLERPGSLVVRAGLPIGPSPDGRTGHWDWLRYRSDHNFPITIVSDECRSAVWADHLARRVVELAESSAVGLRHVAATRVVSRIELANHLFALLDKPAGYVTEPRSQRAAPHLGHVELATVYNDSLSRPLESVLDNKQQLSGNH
jgi:dTDP-4-dehydrorhamnose reductase